MISNTYAKAYKEVLEIIKYFPEEEYKKIPEVKIKFYQENMDKNYVFAIDPSIDLSKQNISKEASAIIVTLYRDYFATEEEKKKINDLVQLNEKKIEIEKNKKYNSENLFKEDIKDQQNINSRNINLIKQEKNFFGRLKDFIMKLLHIKD